MGCIWTHLERISAFLEPDERQSVLGDIQERGATPRALFDLIALVALRQLQAWKSWRPWLVAASLCLPTLFVVFSSRLVAQSFYPIPVFALAVDPWVTFGTPFVLAWTTGFSLGSIGKHRTASVLPLLAVLFAWSARDHVRMITRQAPSEAAIFLTAITIIAALAFIHGFVKGFQRRPVPISLAIALAILGAPVVAWFPPSWLFIPYAAATFWPAVYAIRSAARSSSREPSNAP